MVTSNYLVILASAGFNKFKFYLARRVSTRLDMFDVSNELRRGCRACGAVLF